jgi:hypothetical protein
MKTMPNGKKVRLHFTAGGNVNEAKNMETGATHTPGEFAQDRKMLKKRKMKKMPNKPPMKRMKRMGYEDMDGGDYGL